MGVGLSTTSILDLDNPKKYMNYISDAGFHSMMLDLSVFYTKYNLENHGTGKLAVDVEKLYEQFDTFVEQGVDCSICFNSVYTPHLRWDTKRTDLNELLLQIGKKCIGVCRRVNCQYIIVQPLFAGIMKTDRWQDNYRYYLELGKQAQKENVCILLENQCDNINGHLVRGMCTDISATSKLIDVLNKELDSEAFGFCLDTAVCSLCGQDMGEMILELDKRLKAVLVREGDGIHEMGRLPSIGGSNMGWLSLVRGLRQIEYDGLLIMDAGYTLQQFSHLLRPQIYPLIKSVADFFCWQIEMEKQVKKYPVRVLFGAGKMCQSYMKCYGQSYPPLFICDNNPQLWGAKVCGLDVKSPESLQQLPKDCGVIICNVFYEEIADQLGAMGIRNIATFNDEYMP